MTYLTEEESQLLCDMLRRQFDKSYQNPETVISLAEKLNETGVLDDLIEEMKSDL